MPLQLPGPDEAIVHLHSQGQQLGPLSRRELHRRVRVGEASTEDHFWLPEMEGWETIASHPELFRDLEAPEPSAQVPEAGAGTVMIPRSALGDLAQEDEAPPREASTPAGEIGTVLIPQGLDLAAAAAGEVTPSALATQGFPAVGAQTVKFPAGTNVADMLQQQAEAAQQASAEPAMEAEETPPTDQSGEATGEPMAVESRSTDTAPETEDDRLDSIFTDLVEASWVVLEEQRFAQHIDEVFLGAVITGALDVGWSLIDLESDGTHHFLRFENLEDSTRLIFRLRHLTADLATARVLGQKASVVIGYGQKAPNAKDIVAAVRDELKGGFMRNPEPGTITIDGDLASGYVYAQIDLFFAIDGYVAEDYSIDHALLAEHLHATIHALRKYLLGRFFS